MDFLKWYKNIVESAEEEPPASVWEEIQNELDIEAVWTSVKHGLPAGKRTMVMQMMAVAASLLLIIGVGTLLFINTADKEPAGSILYTEHFRSLTDPLKIEPVIQTTLSAPLEFPAVRRVTAVAEEQAHGIAVRHDQAGYELKPLPELEYNPVSYDTESQLADLLFSPFGEEKVAERPRFTPSGYYAGLSGYFANTWLVNNKTMQGLRPDEFTSSLPSFGYSIGLVAGMKLSNRFDLQAELLLTSLSRQNYNEYLHGKYINNSMQFNYSGLSLSGKWYFIGNEGQGRHSLILGAYTGILRNAMQDLDGEILSLRKDYNLIDYGIITGYEYNYPLGSRLSLGTGIQAKLGLNNIFAGNEMIPYYLNSTRNASVNLILSVRYNSR